MNQGPRHILTRQTAAAHLASINSRLGFRDSNSVKNPDFRVLQVICGLAASFKKSHCYPSQEKLLTLLKRFTGRTMSRRTLNRHLKRLEADQWLRRIRRHTRDRKLGFVMRSTCYVPMWRACWKMARAASDAFSLVKTQLGHNESVRVTKLAQYLNRSINRLSLPT